MILQKLGLWASSRLGSNRSRGSIKKDPSQKGTTDQQIHDINSNNGFINIISTQGPLTLIHNLIFFDRLFLSFWFSLDRRWNFQKQATLQLLLKLSCIAHLPHCTRDGQRLHIALISTFEWSENKRWEDIICSLWRLVWHFNSNLDWNCCHTKKSKAAAFILWMEKANLLWRLTTFLFSMLFVFRHYSQKKATYSNANHVSVKSRNWVHV